MDVLLRSEGDDSVKGSCAMVITHTIHQFIDLLQSLHWYYIFDTRVAYMIDNWQDK